MPPHHDRVLADLLDERVASTVVGDGQAKGRAVLDDLDRLLVALDVGKEKVVEANLAAEQARHVHLVRVERAVENLVQRGGTEGRRRR